MLKGSRIPRVKERERQKETDGMSGENLYFMLNTSVKAHPTSILERERESEREKERERERERERYRTQKPTHSLILREFLLGQKLVSPGLKLLDTTAFLLLALGVAAASVKFGFHLRGPFVQAHRGGELGALGVGFHGIPGFRV